MRAVLLSIVFAASVFAQNLVTSERLVNALKEQQNWLTYWGNEITQPGYMPGCFYLIPFNAYF